MCVAIVKKPGIGMPTDNIIATCWENNPDGAGYMFLRSDEVHIRKGFMKLKHLRRALRFEQFGPSDSVSIHFRIATSGGVSRENTHPFPVLADRPALKSCHTKADVGVVHNGIFDFLPEDIDDSDTQAFILHVLGPLKDRLKDQPIQSLIDLATAGSRLAFLDNTGVFSLYGNWITDTTSGLLFSNKTYLVQLPKSVFGVHRNWYQNHIGSKPSLGLKEVVVNPTACFVCDREGIMLDDDDLCQHCASEFSGQPYGRAGLVF